MTTTYLKVCDKLLGDEQLRLVLAVGSVGGEQSSRCSMVFIDHCMLARNGEDDSVGVNDVPRGPR